MSILFITHDLGVISELCDRVIVMYAGRVVEEARTSELLSRPLHPYTQALLESTPRLDLARGGTLQAISGMPPRLGQEPIRECTFAPRCRYARAECRLAEPALDEIESGARRRRCVVPVAEVEARRDPGARPT
jgi:oligopeptide/dipeptide ABC transporter ATP-binding protein